MATNINTGASAIIAAGMAMAAIMAETPYRMTTTPNRKQRRSKAAERTKAERKQQTESRRRNRKLK